MANLNIEEFYKAFPTMGHRRNRFPYKKEINWNMNMGDITPIAAIRVVPGVTYNLDLATVLRVSPLVTTPMDNAIAKFFAFYNPDRNTWNNYKYWFGEKQNPEDPENEPTYLVPKVKIPELSAAAKAAIKSGNYENISETVMNEIKSRYNTFYDCIGCPPEVGGYEIDAFLPRTDRQIYNNFYRNQSLENALAVNKTDSDDDYNENAQLRKICKPRDFFTQLLPTQNGTSPVKIPVGDRAPVVGTGMTMGLTNGTNQGGLEYIGGAYLTAHTGAYGKNTSTDAGIDGQPVQGHLGLTKDASKSGLEALLSLAEGAPLEGLYQAIAYNTLQYITSRGGNRYFEQLSNVYGVVNPDGVLDIPEFLGSSTQIISFETVTQTSATDNEPTGVGTQNANGYMEDYNNIINKSFGEFGWIIIYGTVTHNSKYQQGISKLMQTSDPLELFNPIFNNIGDEAVYRSEIYAQSDTVVNEQGQPVNEEVLGYGKRNARIIYPVNEIHGIQRSSYPQSMDTTHFAEYYSENPILNKEFDKVSDEGFKRALQVQDEPQFLCNSLITGTIDVEIPINAVPAISPTIQFN